MGTFTTAYSDYGVGRKGAFDRNRITSDVTVITEPTAEPVTLSEVKAAMGVSHDDDDQMISGYIKSARRWAESYLNTYIMTQVVEITMDAFPGWEFGLGLWPLQSIDSVKYDDTSSPITEQTLTVNTNYYADTTAQCGRIKLIDDIPDVTSRPNAVKIRCTVGYADTSASPADLRDGVPEELKTGLKLYVRGLYESDPCAKLAARESVHHLQVKCGGL